MGNRAANSRSKPGVLFHRQMVNLARGLTGKPPLPGRRETPPAIRHTCKLASPEQRSDEPCAACEKDQALVERLTGVLGPPMSAQK